MSRSSLLPLFLLLSLPFAVAWADSSPSLSGLTGLVRVPTAEVLADGDLRLGYNLFDDVESPGIAGTVVYHVGLGFLPGVEGALGMGNAALGQDLTLHGKWRVRAEDGRWPAVAIGVTDLKRLGSGDPTPFVVATKRCDGDRLALTLGAALGEANSGVLVGASYRVLPGVELQAEYDTDRVNAGIAVRAAEGLWLRVADTDIGSVVSASYQFPLVRERRIAVAAIESGPSTFSAEETVNVAQQALVALGMENVRVMLTQTGAGEQLRARYENRRYTLDEADGMRAVLAALARVAPVSVETIELTLLQREVPVARLATNVDIYRRYLAGEVDSDAFRDQLRVELLPAEVAPGAVQADTRVANRSFGHTDLMLGPGVLNTFGTEVSSFEYGITLRPEVEAPLGWGLLANARWSYPLAGELVENDPKRLEQDRLVLGYLFRPAPRIIAQGVAGRFLPDTDGAALEAAMPVGRRGLLHGVAASLQLDGEDGRQTYLLGEYRHIFPAIRAEARLFGGQFVDGDQGWGVDVMRFFGNLQIGIGYRDTDTSDILEARAAIPLSPSRQPQRPSSIRLRTPDYLNYRLRSVLTDRSNDLALAAATANELPLGIDLIDTVLDRNRLLPEYLMRGEW